MMMAAKTAVPCYEISRIANMKCARSSEHSADSDRLQTCHSLLLCIVRQAIDSSRCLHLEVADPQNKLAQHCFIEVA